MKVADGFWLSKKGYNVNYASQAYKVETTENSIKVLATPYTLLSPKSHRMVFMVKELPMP